MPPVRRSNALNTCLLLHRIPPELRNGIYELVFERPYERPEWPQPQAFEPMAPPTNSWTRTVDLLHAQPPEKALLLTCRQIHSETQALYLEAYRKYWTSTVFSVQVSEDRAENTTLVHFLQDRPIGQKERERRGWVHDLRDEDVAHIYYLMVKHAFRDEDLDPPRPSRFHHGLWSGALWEDKEGRMLLVPRQTVDAATAAGFTTWRLVNVARFNVIILVGLEPRDGHEIYMSDEEIERAKRVAGKKGLTKGELVAVMAWISRGDVVEDG